MLRSRCRSGSTDKTPQIAERYKAAWLSHPFENYALQRNWAQQNLPLGAPIGERLIL